MKSEMNIMRSVTELLAPAGDEAALRAAVCAGADAVYLGFQAFGARASAANFDAEQLERAASYSHLHHVRVYVTVNTLVKEREMPEVYDALAVIAKARADAVIVQDLGVAAMAKRFFPSLTLHASTQMGIHTAAGARFAQSIGMERVVLARECSLEDIAQVAATGMETEVFVHGALCAGVSGQCLMSSMAGGRSGNRGRCAQPCRQGVRLGSRWGALLSMRDLCLRDDLPALFQAGARSFKIEGRLKRPEYVAVVTDSYRRALDGLLRGDFVAGDRSEREWLMQAFHRGGFTRGHAMGEEDADLCETRHVGHGGVRLGKVTHVKNGLATVRLEGALRDGDGLQLRGRTEADLRYAGKDREAGEDAALRLRAETVAGLGDLVFRLTDVRQTAWAGGLVERPIPIRMTAELLIGKPMRLTLTDGQQEVTVAGDVVQTAQTRAVTREEVARQLAKLGDTPFCLPEGESVSVQLDMGAFAPVSGLNALRRSGVERLMQARAMAFFGREKETLLNERETRPYAQAANDAELVPPHQPSWTDTLAVSFSQAGMGTALLEAGATLLLWEPTDLRLEALESGLTKLPEGAWLKLPPQLSDEALRRVTDTARVHATRLGGVALGSVGQLGVNFGLPVALGSGVPVTNHMALEELSKATPAFYTLWPEWSYAELLEMPQTHVPCLLGVYGRERLMLLNHCPERVARGLSENRKACALCQGPDMACGQKDAALIDRKGYRFPLTRTRMEEGCVLSVWGAVPTDLRRHDDKRRTLGAGMLVTLTVEPMEEQLRLVAEFAALIREEAISAPEGTTTGHLLRGVE